MKILKFSADYCAPCKAMSRELANYSKYKIEELDMDKHYELFDEFSIRKVPTLVLIDDELNEIDRYIGSITLIDFESWINKKRV